MNAKRITIGAGIAAVCLAAAVWFFPGFRTGPQSNATADVRHASDWPSLRLNGTVVPPLAVPVNARIQELDVQSNTWVVKGQVIGETEDDGDPDPAVVAETRLRLEQADAAVQTARRQWLTLEPGDAAVGAGTSQRTDDPALRDPESIKAEHTIEHNDELFRRKIETDLQHDEALAASRKTLRRAESEREQANRAVTDSDEGNSGVPSARDAVRRALERRRLAQLALLNLSKSPRIVPVVSPSDGLLVERDGYRGAFDVLTGLRRLVVETRIADSERRQIHRGQTAEIYLGGQKAAPLRATVDSIGEGTVTPSGATEYPVTLSAANPDATRPNGTDVEIVIPRESR